MRGSYSLGDTVNVTVKTYGNGTFTTGKSYYTEPVTYVAKNINDIVPYLNVARLSAVTDKPTGGVWQPGDVLDLWNPTEARTAPYVYVSNDDAGAWV